MKTVDEIMALVRELSRVADNAGRSRGSDGYATNRAWYAPIKAKEQP